MKKIIHTVILSCSLFGLSPLTLQAMQKEETHQTTKKDIQKKEKKKSPLSKFLPEEIVALLIPAIFLIAMYAGQSK